MIIMGIRQALLALIVLSMPGATRLRAHDLWLIPPERVKAGEKVIVRAHSGMEFPLSEHAINPERMKSRNIVRPDGKVLSLEAAGTDDEQKSGLLQFLPEAGGIYVASVQTNPRLIELSAEEFNHYLVSDGLPHIYELRHREKNLDQPGKERYSKSPKALIRIGNDDVGDPCRVLGLPLEIVPKQNPFKLRAGETLRVKVLFQQQPLKDAHLGWDVPGDGVEHSGTVRTNSQGEALIPIGQTGLMTIRLTHMTRPKTAEYEWESFWTSLTFRIP